MKGLLDLNGVNMLYRICTLIVLSIGATVAVADEKSVERLLEACRAGNEQLVAVELLRDPKAVEEANLAWQPLLGIALNHDTGGCVSYLVAKGASPDLMIDGQTPLEIAIRIGKRRTIETLAEKASVTDLPSFARLRRIDLALDAFARESSERKLTDTAFPRFYTSIQSADADWRVLVQAMEAAGTKEIRFFNLLMFLARMSVVPLESELTDQAGPVLRRHLSQDQLRQLAVAAIHVGNGSMLRLLRRAGLDPDKSVRDAAVEVFQSATTNWDGLRAIPLINEKLVSQEEMNDAMRRCVTSGEFDLMKALLDAGVSKDLADADGVTLLMAAITLRRAAIIEELLHRKANIRLRDSSDRDVLQYAKKFWPEPALIDAINKSAEP